MSYRSGRHFLQIPGPTNVPERVLRAIDSAVIDHRGPGFADLTREILDGLRRLFRTPDGGHVFVYPASGNGAWEAALVNTLSPGDRVLMFDNGFFAAGWRDVAERHGLEVEWAPGRWRRGVDAAIAEGILHEDAATAGDPDERIRAVCVVHNETSTGVTSDIAAVREAIDRAGHPALLMVDAVSSLGSIDVRQDAWGVDVVVAGSQKGLMMPPGLGLNSVSERALAASESAGLARSYWDWRPMLEANRDGYFPYTPATNLLYGLREALSMLEEEGLERVFARHARLAEATRRAVSHWGLSIFCENPAEYSDTVTTVLVPDGVDADGLRALVLDRYDMSLGTGLGKLSGRAFRIGHLGDFNDLMLMGTLAGVEMGLLAADVPFSRGGVAAAMEYLVANAASREAP